MLALVEQARQQEESPEHRNRGPKSQSLAHPPQTKACANSPAARHKASTSMNRTAPWLTGINPFLALRVLGRPFDRRGFGRSGRRNRNPPDLLVAAALHEFAYGQLLACNHAARCAPRSNRSSRGMFHDDEDILPRLPRIR